jgi:hypothetical protein
MAAEKAHRMTDSEAGPNASASARPMTGLSAKQAGTRARRRRFMNNLAMGLEAFAEPRRLCKRAGNIFRAALSLGAGKAIFIRDTGDGSVRASS